MVKVVVIFSKEKFIQLKEFWHIRERIDRDWEMIGFESIHE